MITKAVNIALQVRHPLEEDLGFLYGTIFTGPPEDQVHHSRNVCIFANAEVDRSAALQQAVASQVLADVDTAYSGLVVQRERVVLLRDTYLPKALQARRTVEFAYRRGGVSLLDYLDAQRTYRETALEHLRALGNFWAAAYQLEAAVGGSLEPSR